MQTSEILEQVTEVFRGVLRQPELTLSGTTTAADVSGWDSLNHAILLAEVQKKFGIRFSVQEVLRLKTVGELCMLVASKL